MKHKVSVTQVFRVERNVEFDVEAETAEDAVNLVDAGDVEKPDWGVWTEVEYRLESEEVIAL